MRNLILAFTFALTLGPGAVSQAPDQRYVAGDVLVCPKPDRGTVVQQRLVGQGLEIADTDAFSGLLRVRVVAGQETIWIKRLTGDPDIVYAERNGVGQGGLVPNDTWFSAQWHLRNTGQTGGSVGADIRATDAWDVTTGWSGVTIAVLDTGIDSDHPEFVGRIDPDGYDFVNEDNDPEADHPHGSNVSGVMCANADNNFGVAGVDWQCNVLPVKVLDQFNLGTTFDLAEGLNYCATQADVQVVSMSLINYPGNATLVNALQNARSAGKVLLACAGNGGVGNANTSFPGASPLTISIGATTHNDTRAGFSGTGSALDFVAPGDDVVSVLHNSSNNQFSTVSGCSFATPIVAGVVGLAMGRAHELGIPLPNHDQVFDLLQAGAVDQVGPANEDTPGRDDFFGYGRIDARLTVDAVSQLESCEYGSVGIGFGGPFDVVRINGAALVGGSRTVPVPINAPTTLSVDVPPTLPQPGPVPPFFLLWARTGDLSTASPFVLPLGIGEMCFDPTDSLTFGLFADVAPWSTTTPPVPAGFVVTLQGVMLHTLQADIAVTNVVTLDAQPFPPPTILSLSPPAAAPGQAVTISGSGFLPGLGLDVNGAPIPTASIVSITANAVEFLAPATAPCDTSLTVTNPDGQTGAVTFNPSPVLNNVFPIGGTPAAGGTQLLLIGENFAAGTTVTIGGTAMTITSISQGFISGTLPPGNVGPAAIVITTPFGCTVSGSLTYTP